MRLLLFCTQKQHNDQHKHSLFASGVPSFTDSLSLAKSSARNGLYRSALGTAEKVDQLRDVASVSPISLSFSLYRRTLPAGLRSRSAGKANASREGSTDTATVAAAVVLPLLLLGVFVVAKVAPTGVAPKLAERPVRGDGAVSSDASRSDC